MVCFPEVRQRFSIKTGSSSSGRQLCYASLRRRLGASGGGAPMDGRINWNTASRRLGLVQRNGDSLEKGTASIRKSTAVYATTGSVWYVANTIGWETEFQPQNLGTCIKCGSARRFFSRGRQPAIPACGYDMVCELGASDSPAGQQLQHARRKQGSSYSDPEIPVF